MHRTTALWRAFLGLGDVASTKGRYLEDREEGLEMYFCRGVWIGAGAAAGVGAGAGLGLGSLLGKQCPGFPQNLGS